MRARLTNLITNTYQSLSSTWYAPTQAAAFKNVVSKGVMKKPWAKALGSANNYAVVTILALIFTIPLVLFFDAKDAVAVYKQVVAAGTGKDVIKYSVLSGLAFYLYNEVRLATALRACFASDKFIGFLHVALLHLCQLPFPLNLCSCSARFPPGILCGP